MSMGTNVLLSGIVGAAVAGSFAAAALRLRGPASIDRSGWKVLKPSWFLHGSFIALLVCTFLVAVFLISGGSSAPDAATQNIYAMALGVGFGCGATYLGWATYGREVSWSREEIRLRTAVGTDFVRRFSEVFRVTKFELLGEYRVEFQDGSTLRFSQYLGGAQELANRLDHARDSVLD